MGRADPRFNGLDVIRMVENNLTVADKRLVFAWFFSTIPIKEPQVDVIQILLDLLSAVPVAGTFTRVFQISLATAQVAVDIAELFQFEFEEQDVELARVILELESLREEFKDQREELLRCQILLDRERERSAALLMTQALLEEELRRLEAQPIVDRDVQIITAAVAEIKERVRFIRLNSFEIRQGGSPGRFAIFIDNGAITIEQELVKIEGAISG